jgi:hypothetical protein
VAKLNACSQETTEHRSQDSPSTVFERLTYRLRRGANHSTATPSVTNSIILLLVEEDLVIRSTFFFSYSCYVAILKQV